MERNACSGCPRPCCMGFKINREIVDPKETKELLKKYPFITKVGMDAARSPNGRVVAVGVYNCEKYEVDTGRCTIYGTGKRPEFCRNTGEMRPPHSECLLIKSDSILVR